jgi:hypothetical protein
MCEGGECVKCERRESFVRDDCAMCEGGKYGMYEGGKCVIREEGECDK